MEEIGNSKIQPLKGLNVNDKRVLLRLDINSPVDPVTRRVTGTNRIRKSIPTLRYLLEGGARTAIIAHQGDTLDYHNLTPMDDHTGILSELLGTPVVYIDDVCGPAAQQAIKALKPGQIILLGNLRYLGEELSTFEKDVKLSPEDMANTWLVHNLAPLFDLYVNDAFSAAHRNSPSMVAFEYILPTAAGFLFFDEYSALSAVLNSKRKPCVFVLGGAKISDAFDILETVLQNGTADRILIAGVTGQVMLVAAGINLGEATHQFLKERDLLVFVEKAKKCITAYPNKIEMPVDLAYELEGKRIETDLIHLPQNVLYSDIGIKTIAKYSGIIETAGTIFANGPSGVYENPLFEAGTRGLWQAIAKSPAYSVMGGGDTVNSVDRYIRREDISYLCTAGGAMVRFMSGRKLPLIEAMENAKRPKSF